MPCRNQRAELLHLLPSRLINTQSRQSWWRHCWRQRRRRSLRPPMESIMSGLIDTSTREERGSNGYVPNPRWYHEFSALTTRLLFLLLASKAAKAHSYGRLSGCKILRLARSPVSRFAWSSHVGRGNPLEPGRFEPLFSFIFRGNSSGFEIVSCGV